jgi:hypothetical protein
MKISCPHYSRKPGNKHNGLCALGWFGGKPFAGNCNQCLSAGRNTPEAFAAAQAKYTQTHPESFRGKSGCCDNATNYPL